MLLPLLNYLNTVPPNEPVAMAIKPFCVLVLGYEYVAA